VLDRRGFRTAAAGPCSRSSTYPQAATAAAIPAAAPPIRRRNASGPDTFETGELVSAGHKFFGNVSRGLASIIERAVSQWGLPNGYVLGEEGSALCCGPAVWRRHALHQERRRPAGLLAGPSVGFDWGGDGARTMTLVYNLPATNAIYQRFVGIDGSAYIIGGFGMTALDRQQQSCWCRSAPASVCGSAPMSAISNIPRARPGTRSELILRQ
jgi:hypothetical protein